MSRVKYALADNKVDLKVHIGYMVQYLYGVYQ